MTTDRPDIELLADLDAGLLDEPRAGEVRTAALADPSSAAVLDALAATRAELAAMPCPPVPPAAAARWTAVLEQVARQPGAPEPGPAPAAGDTPAHPTLADRPAPEWSGTSQCGPTASPRGQPGAPTPIPAGPPSPIPPAAARRDPPGATARILPAPPTPIPPAADPRAQPDAAQPDAAQPDAAQPDAAQPDAGSRVPPGAAPRVTPATASRPAPAGPPSRSRPRRRRPRPALVAGVLLAAVLVAVGLARTRPAPTTVSGVELASAGRAALGVGDAGEFADPARRAACLRSISPPGVAAGAPLLGGRAVELDGRPGVLMVLGTGVLGSFDVVVVGPGCDALLAVMHVGR